MAQPTELTASQVSDLQKGADQDLRMLAPIIGVRNASLTFTNELFILRHLLTNATISLGEAEALFTESDPATVRSRDELLRRAGRAYGAAILTLDAAEELLPRKQRTMDGERFWDRFTRVSDEREALAAQNFLTAESKRAAKSRNT